MSERRMFAKSIIDSDAFLDMPLSSQALYFHLSMRADDEGFINNPKKIQRMIGASDDDMKVLLAKNFIIAFESGVIVIKHWKIHNYIRADRLVGTNYKDERNLLDIKENGAYTIREDLAEISPCQTGDRQMSDICPSCQTSDRQVTVKCQHRIGKDSIGKDSIGEYRIGEYEGEGDSDESPAPAKPVIHKRGEYGHVMLTDDEYERLRDTYGDELTKTAIECVDEYCQQTGKRYKDYNLTIRKWGINSAKERKAKRGFSNSDDAYAIIEKKIAKDGVW